MDKSETIVTSMGVTFISYYLFVLYLFYREFIGDPLNFPFPFEGACIGFGLFSGLGCVLILGMFMLIVIPTLLGYFLGLIIYNIKRRVAKETRP